MATPSFSVVFDSNNNYAPGLTDVKREAESLPPALGEPRAPQPLGPPPSEQSTPLTHVKTEPEELTVDSMQRGEEVEQQRQAKDLHFLESINELSDLSSAIGVFKRSFDELQNHIDFIRNAIDTCEQCPQEVQTQTAPTPTPIVNGEQTEKQRAETTKIDINVEAAEANAAAPAKSVLGHLCESMSYKSLRKYLVSHLLDAQKLRQEVPLALKFAPDPAKLVLDCIGRFYLQGKKAYTTDSQMTPGREACILLLECLLRMIDGQITMDAAVKQEAERAAVDWRKRLITEGGVSKASEIDAKGLLLLVACYGFPKGFKNEDVWDLVQASNSRQIAEVFRRSRVLVWRVLGVIERMMNKGMKIEAVDVAATFGLEEKFPPQKLLTSFLRESKETWKISRKEANDTPILLKNAKEKQLAALKSVLKFLGDRQLDPTKLLSGWQLKEKIVKLENDIADMNKKIINDQAMQKRKADEYELLNNFKSQETKRLRFALGGLPLICSPNVGLIEPRALSHVDGQSSYNVSMQSNFLDGGLSSHFNHYPAPTSALYGSVAGSLPENARAGNAFGTSAGRQAAMHAAGVGLPAAYAIPSSSTNSFAGANRETPVDTEENMMVINGQPYSRHGVRDVSFGDGSRFVRQPASGLFGPSPAIEGFAGLPNSPPAGAANRRMASDLYRFADTVIEGEYGSSTLKPGLLGPYRSSKM